MRTPEALFLHVGPADERCRKPIGNFELDAEAEAAIVAFLRTLTDRTLYGQPIINRR